MARANVNPFLVAMLVKKRVGLNISEQGECMEVSVPHSGSVTCNFQ